jgi:DNA polymerase
MGAEGSDEDLGLLVRQWRQANPRIVRLWDLLDRAFRSGGSAGDFLTVEKDGKDRLIRLPSGRAICYRKCGLRDGRLTFLSPRGRTDTYGGRLAENVTQAVARDVMAEALVRLVGAGYTVVGHVHDEVIVETEDQYGVEKLMLTPPEWADGLPIDGEGFTCRRYRKG